MKGKTRDEAKTELQSSGVSGDTLELILPHKVGGERGSLGHMTSCDLFWFAGV